VFGSVDVIGIVEVLGDEALNPGLAQVVEETADLVCGPVYIICIGAPRSPYTLSNRRAMFQSPPKTNPASFGSRSRAPKARSV
jgi:hypothetical protein